MIITQHYLACLSHASYLVGDERTGRAVVVDPRRDVDVYVEEAAERGLRIERVIETHIHADFLSGHLELAARTGAVISFGAGADLEFPVDLLGDGQRLSLGDVTLEVIATPGHTPESICIAVYEHAGDAAPHAVLTGDTLFVGDVGRPDLLASTGVELSADSLARRLYHSLHDRLLALPDNTRVLPAHGAGSSCGRRLSSQTSSTIGEQRRTNYALQAMSEDDFVTVVTEGQPAKPTHFAYNAGRNRQLHELADDTAPPLLDLDNVLARQAAGAALLDCREPADYASGHVRGALNAGLQGRFAEWAAEVLTPEQDVVLVGDPALATDARVRLARVGYDRVVGQLAEPARVFAERADVVEGSSRLSIEQFAELRGLDGTLQLLDVRNPGETAGGTIAGAREIPLAALAGSLDGLERSAPTVVYCASGYRSLIAASLLRASGFSDVSDLLGGYGAWVGAGLPVAGAGATTGVGATPQVSARAAKALLDSGALLLDVREPDEWLAEHVAGSLLIPMASVSARRDELPRERRIAVICRSGGRSAAVTDSLRAWGFDAVNVAGGMCAWTAGGLPAVSDAREGGLVVHGTNPLNCETSICALIGGVVMPNARFYVRNHFATPTVDTTTWRLDVGGLVDRPVRLTMRELQAMRSESQVVTLECAGNGREMFDPPVAGERWRLGAVSTAEWTGVPLVEVLERAGIRGGAREVVLRGADSGTVDGGAGRIRFERSLAVEDALCPDVLLAYAMNGEPLPVEHGRPLRALVPGWYAVASVKWLTGIEVVDHEFDGYFHSERYFYEWQRDGGETVREPVRLQRVRSLITEPETGSVAPTEGVVVRGVAWSGAAPIAHVDVRVGDGPWQRARLVGLRRRHGWQWWELDARFDARGRVTIASRATDLAGNVQPERPEWNRLGYGGNAIQRVEVSVG